MIRHITTCIFASLAVVFSASAQNIDKVLTKDGAVYEGYIAEQIPGSKVVVKTEIATLFVNSSDVSGLVYTTRDVNDLPSRLRDWVRKNRPDEKKVQVASLKVGGKSYDNVIVLENGFRIKMLSFADDTFELNWKNIVKTSKTEAWMNNAAGINDVVTLVDGKHFVGHVIEQIIGSELRIKLLSGEVNAVRFSDILSIRSEQADSTRPFAWDKQVLLDRVELKDGSSVEGFITSRLMGRYLTMITRNDAMEKEIPLNTVVKYVKVPNKDIANKGKAVEEERKSRSDNRKERERQRAESVDEQPVDAKRNNNDCAEVYLNGLPMTLNSVVLCDGNLNVIKNPVVDKVGAGTSIKIEMPSSFNTADLKIVNTQMRPVAMMSSVNGGNVFPTFNKKDIDRSYVGYGITNLDNGNVMVSIVISDPGIYVFIPTADDNKCIVFEVIG